MLVRTLVQLNTFCAGCCCIIQHSVLQTGQWSLELPTSIFSVMAENHSQNVLIYAVLSSCSSSQELSCRCPLKSCLAFVSPRQVPAISPLPTAPPWALPFFPLYLQVSFECLLSQFSGDCPKPHCCSLPFLQPVGVGCDIFEDRPRLREWRRRVEDAVGKELFFQAHEMILNIKELSNIQIDPQLKEQLAPVLMKMLKWINLS